MNKTICSTLLTILLLAFGCSSTKPVTQMCRVDEAALVEFAKQKIKEKMPEVDLANLEPHEISFTRHYTTCLNDSEYSDIPVAGAYPATSFGITFLITNSILRAAPERPCPVGAVLKYQCLTVFVSPFSELTESEVSLCASYAQGYQGDDLPKLPKPGAVDLPAVIIDGMPQYSDGAIRTVTVGDVTNRLDDRYPVKNLCFNKGATNQIQMVWGGDRMPPPIMLESNQVYRFEFGCKKITDGGPDTKRGQSIFATVKRYYLRKLWKDDKLLLENWDPEHVRDYPVNTN